jgi:pimeloyl-ACP methyl ester carboxylesterase
VRFADQPEAISSMAKASNPTTVILWNMKRRSFLKYSAAAFGTTASMSPLSQSAQAATLLESTQIADALNPTGIRVAGIRMIPVAGGKYKVWTKRIGSGSVKVLLLHGGPGFPHDYLEAMESFLPQAGIEMYYYDQLGVGNSDVPMIRRSGLCLDISARSRRFVADSAWIILCFTATRGAAFLRWSTL